MATPDREPPHRVPPLCEEALTDLVADADLIDDPLAGLTLGNYTLEKRYASGGMGAVYLAHRSDGAYRERVAVKVLRRGLDSEHLLRRFRTERQILARLRHPGIANLLDGGITPDGRPYLVMEFVEGRPLDRYCEEERVPLRPLIALLRDVAEVLQHAHRNLVVHRDLKPGNILVTDTGEIKLMDFGIAKLLSNEGGNIGESAQTLAGLQVLTPGWAAPEQIRGEPITTATDVFGLGLVAYHVLTGCRPFGSENSTAQELSEATCSDTPRRPSHVAPYRGLDQDLDNVCLKALHQDPEQRYESPGHLAEDLTRYLEGRPVLARPATLGYQLRKFLRRHRRETLAAALVFTALVGLVSWNNIRLAEERDRARRGEAKAEQIATFLTEIFVEADPDQSRGAEITAREILARGAENIDRRLADQPDLQAALLDVLGGVHANLGMFDRGRALLDRALNLKLAHHGDGHPEVATTATNLADLESEVGRFARADSLLRAALTIRRREEGPSRAEIAHIQQYRGVMALRLGQYDEAEKLYAEALEIYETEGSTDPSYPICLNDLALLWLETGRRDDAEPLFRRALSLQEEKLGRDHPEYATTLFNLSLLLKDRGDHEAAEPILRQVLALDRQHFDPDHPTVAFSLTNLAGSLDFMGSLSEAEDLYEEALAIRRATLAPGHPDLIKSIGSLGLNLGRQGHYARAESLLRESVDLAREHLGRHRLTAVHLDHLGWVLRDLNRCDEALALHREALEINEEVLGPDHKKNGISLMHLAASLQHLGKLAEARQMQERGLLLATNLFGPDNIFTASQTLGLARILLEQGNLVEAAIHAERSEAVIRQKLGEDNTRLASALQLRGRIHHAAGEWDDAVRCLRQALAIHRDRLGDGNPATAWTRVKLAEFLLEQGQEDEAKVLILEALPVLENTLPEKHPRINAARELTKRI